MNERSLLCRFLEENPEDWERLLKERHAIKVKREGDYAIFNYGVDCCFADPLVQEARGIILDVARREVVCWPFRKFGNHNESYADSIDWESARVLEKVDGSIIKLWYDAARGAWQFSTNGTVRAEDATVDQIGAISYLDVIRDADNYGKIPFDRLDRSNTYIFELVSPMTRVVVKYERTSLYHIGTRNNQSGEESDVDIGIKKPASYPLSSLSLCLQAAVKLNRGGEEDVSAEGFVVVDRNWHRVKVKSPDYLMMHRLRTPGELSKRDCVSMLLSDSPHIAIVCDANPALIPRFKFYEFHLAELAYLSDGLASLARALLKEYDGDRAAVARVILRHRLAVVGFRALECTERGGEILRRLPFEKIVKLIPDYVTEDLRALFLEAP